MDIIKLTFKVVIEFSGAQTASEGNGFDSLENCNDTWFQIVKY